MRTSTNILARELGILGSMVKIVNFFLDILFPPRATELCIRRFPKEPGVTLKTTTVQNILCLSDYREEIVRSLILENKYHESKLAQELLAGMLQKWLTKQATNIILVPIPLGAERRKTRGYNQVEEILYRLPSSPRYTTTTELLRRIKDTVPQTSLTRAARLKNMKNVFACNNEELQRIYAGQTIVIVDDVATTGTTMQAARAELARHLPASATIICLALAH